MARNLAGMVVVITGASSGIGRALAVQLAGAGARLTLSARRLDRLQALNAELGGNHLVVQADVARSEDCARVVTETVSRFGRLDTLVCNAGYGLAKSTADTTCEEMRQIFQTNVFGTTDTIHAAIPVFKNQDDRDGYRGQIMIVSSVVARRGLPYFGAYCATKAAQLSLGEALRVELRSAHVAVTTVHPVGTETEFFDLAGQHGGSVVPPPAKGEVRQTAATVAAKMVKAIIRPKPEVWPLQSARFGVSIGTFVPSLVDRALKNYRKQIGGN